MGDYGDNTMQHAVITEKFFSEFFHNVKACLRQHTIIAPQKYDENAITLQCSFHQCQQQVHAALLNDFDTPAAIHSLVDLAKAVNLYMKHDTIVSLLVSNCAMYVSRIFQVLGLMDSSTNIGFPTSNQTHSQEKLLTPILDTLMAFRSKVREYARRSSNQDILKECDDFRDQHLIDLGIRLEDKPNGSSLWKLEDPLLLKKEREMKLLELKRKEQEKLAKKIELEKKEALNKLSPAEYMKLLKDGDNCKYSKFNGNGMPTHLYNGEPLNKNQEKKAKKEWMAQQKKHEKYTSKT